MTVITAMKFNNEEGAMVADEQSSIPQYRKYETATKIKEIQCERTIALLGGSGVQSILQQVVADVEREVEKYKKKKKSEDIPDMSGKDLAVLTGRLLVGYKQQLIRDYVQSKYGLDPIEFLSGQILLKDKDGNMAKSAGPVDKSWMDQYNSIISGADKNISELTNNSFLVLTKDNSGTQIYHVSSWVETPVLVPNCYAVIGSGSDAADAELANFLDCLPRARHQNISKLEGLSALLYATEMASRRNIGVGGTPCIAVVNKYNADKSLSVVKIVDENNSRLALEIVKATKKGFVPEKFKEYALKELVYKNAKFEDLEKQMWQKAKGGAERLSRMLRGYKG